MICLKCCWKLEAVAQFSPVKMKLCKKIHKFHKRHLIWSPFLKKTVSPQATVLKRTLPLAFSCEYTVFMWIFLFIFVFSFQKDKSSHCRCSLKKYVLKNFANFTGKHLCWSFFLIKWNHFYTIIKSNPLGMLSCVI